MTDEQRKMLDTTVTLFLKGEAPTTAAVAAALDWDCERVDRVGKELAELGLVDDIAFSKDPN